MVNICSETYNQTTLLFSVNQVIVHLVIVFIFYNLNTSMPLIYSCTFTNLICRMENAFLTFPVYVKHSFIYMANR